MPFVPEDACKAYEQNPDIAYKELEGIKNFSGDPASPRTARRWLKYLKEGVADATVPFVGNESEVTAEEVEQVKTLLKKNPLGLTTTQISEAIDRSPSSAEYIVQYMKEEGFNILDEEKEIKLVRDASVLPTVKPKELADGMEVKLAVLSDLHCGSTCEQITHRKTFINYARELGYRKFLVPGDISTGIKVYKGHHLEMYAPTSEEQEYLCEKAVEPESGEEWYLLGGNHDFSWVKNAETDLVWRVCEKYEQVHFVGYDSADIPLTDRHTVRLWHPSGGSSYAASYRLQKGIEQANVENSLVFSELIEGGNDFVKTILAGHLHRDASVREGGIFALLCSCFEGFTNYLKRKPLFPRIAGNLLTMYLNDAGNVVRDVVEHVSFVEIRDDYKSYPIDATLREPEITTIYRME